MPNPYVDPVKGVMLHYPRQLQAPPLRARPAAQVGDILDRKFPEDVLLLRCLQVSRLVHQARGTPCGSFLNNFDPAQGDLPAIFANSPCCWRTRRVCIKLKKSKEARMLTESQQMTLSISGDEGGTLNCRDRKRCAVGPRQCNILSSYDNSARISLMRFIIYIYIHTHIYIYIYIASHAHRRGSSYIICHRRIAACRHAAVDDPVGSPTMWVSS